MTQNILNSEYRKITCFDIRYLKFVDSQFYPFFPQACMIIHVCLPLQRLHTEETIRCFVPWPLYRMQVNGQPMHHINLKLIRVKYSCFETFC